jgi:GT2 family glycosyltransferase
MAAKRSSAPPVSVGIVTQNSESFLPACLDALHAQRYEKVELLAFDNASADGSVEMVQRRAPESTVIQSADNLGYCAAHNRLIGAAQGEYYLAINPDVTLGRDYLHALVDALEAGPGYGSAMGKLWLAGEEEGRRRIDGTGIFLGRDRHQNLRGHGEIDRGQYDQAGDIFGVDGAAPLFRRQALLGSQVDGQVYDESYFLYMDDVDLGWRMRLFGWRARYVPSATATHDRTFKPGFRRPISRVMRRHAVKNRYLTILKNESRVTWRRDWWRILAYDVRVFAYVLLLEQSSLAAYLNVFGQRARIRAWRDEIRSRASVSKDEIESWFG